MPTFEAFTFFGTLAGALLLVPRAAPGGSCPPDDVAAELDRSAVVVDARPIAAFAAGHVPGAVNIPHDQVAGRVSELDKARWVLDKLQAVRERQAQSEQARIEWCDGARFPYLGETVQLQLDPTHGFSAAGAVLERTPDGARLRVGLPQLASAEQAVFKIAEQGARVMPLIADAVGLLGEIDKLVRAMDALWAHCALNRAEGVA